MAFQYSYAIYSFQHAEISAGSQAKMDAMAADGWRAHTAMPNFTELAVLWERELPKAKQAKDSA